MSELLGYLHHWEQRNSLSNLKPMPVEDDIGHMDMSKRHPVTVRHNTREEESYDSNHRDSRRGQNDWLVTSSV